MQANKPTTDTTQNDTNHALLRIYFILPPPLLVCITYSTLTVYFPSVLLANISPLPLI